MKDLDTLYYFLGIEVTYSSTCLILAQEKYASEILTKAGVSDCKSSFSPAVTTKSFNGFTLADALFSDVAPYRSLVGSL